METDDPGIDTDPMYSTTTTDPEYRAGFRKIDIPRPADSHPTNPFANSTRIYAVVRPHAGGGFAVKIANPAGGTTYSVRSANGDPVESFSFLESLMAKYPA